MKITRTPKRLAEATPEVKNLLSRISAVADDDLPSVLDGVLEWCWPRGDLHYWTGVLNRFDDILSSTCKEYELSKIQRKEFTPERRALLLAILRFSRLLIENCTNRKLYNSYDRLNELLFTRDPAVLETTLRLLLRPAQQWSSQGAGRYDLPISHARLSTIALTFSPRDHGVDMASLVKSDAQVSEELLSVRFEFYRRRSSSDQPASAPQAEAGPSRPVNTTPARPTAASRRDARHTPGTSASAAAGLSTPGAAAASGSGTTSDSSQQEGLTSIKIASVPSLNKDPYDIFQDVVAEHKVPKEDQFELYQKIRFAAMLPNPDSRREMLICRLLAIACYSHMVSESTANTQLFLYEPDIIQKTAALVDMDSGAEQSIQAAAFYALDGLGRFRSKLSEVLSSLSASVSHGTVLRTLRLVIDDLNGPQVTVSEHLIDSLFGLIAFITSTTPGVSMVVGAGLIPLLIQLVDTCKSDVYMIQRTVTRSIGLIDSVTYSFHPAYHQFTDANGITIAVNRVQHEVENDLKDPDLRMEDGLGALYGKLSFGRASLLRNLLKTISHIMATEGIRSLMDTSLLESIKLIMAHRDVFGPQILGLTINIVAQFIHGEPTSLGLIQEKKIPEIFLEIADHELEASSDVIMAIPNAISAICLNESGLKLLDERPIIPRMFDIFTSSRHLPILMDRDNAAMFGSAIDELIRHQPSLKEKVLNSILGVLDKICQLGTSYEPSEETGPRYNLQLVPELSGASGPDSATRLLALGDVVMDEADTLRTKDDDVKNNDVIGYMDVTARFLDGFFQSAAHCKDFLKFDGADKLLRFVSLPCLPYNFSSSMTADSLISLLRYMTEISPSTVLAAILKEVKRGLMDTEEIWTDDANTSSLTAMLGPSSDADLAAANKAFRKLVSLNCRMHLLSDVLPSYAYTGSKTPGAFIQTLHAGVASPQLGQATIAELGDLHGVVTWENILIKATAPPVPAPASKDANPRPRNPQPGLPSNLLEDSAGTVQQPSDAAIEESKTAEEAKDPNIKNSAALRYIMSQLHAASSRVFAEATKLLVFKRSSDLAPRRTAAQIADTIGKSLSKLLTPRESNNESLNLAYATTIVGQVSNTLYDDRPASVSLHTSTLVAFERAGGMTALMLLYERYLSALDAHFQGEIDSADAEANIRLGHLCGGLKVSLSLLQNLSAARPLLDSPSTQQLTAKDPSAGEASFKPHELLIRLRSIIMSPVVQTFQRAWLPRVPVSVNRSVIQTLLHIMQGDGEKAPKPKEPAAASSSTQAQGGLGPFAPHTSLGGSLGSGGLSAIMGNLGGGLAGSLGSARPRQPVTADERRIQQLIDMGFPRPAARHALVRYNNNANAATEYLLAHPEVVGSMTEEPEPEPTAAATEPSTTSGSAEQGAESSAAPETTMAADTETTAADGQQAAQESTEESAASADAPAPADGDTAMAEAAPASSEAPDSDVKKPSDEAPVEAAETPSEVSVAKTALDESRQALSQSFLGRGLELADHHEELVFDVKDSVCIFIDDSDKTSASLRSLIDGLQQIGSEAFNAQEVKAATRLHLLALLLNERIILPFFDDDMAQLACSVISSLAAGYDTRASQEKHARWLAPLCLVASSVLSRKEEPVAIEQPSEDADAAQLHPVTRRSALEAEAHAFFELCLRCLNTADKLTHEEMLGLYRLLVLLTRNPHISAALAKRGGVLTLLKPFSTDSKKVAGCQSYLVICLRHIIESQSVLRATIRQYLRTWFAARPHISANGPTYDVQHTTESMSQIALRDPDLFLEVMREEVEITKHSTKDGAASVSPVAKAGSNEDRSKQQDDKRDAAASAADETFDLPPSPTKGAMENDAQMDDLTKGKDHKEQKAGQTSNADSDAVVHLLLTELLRTSRERSALWSKKALQEASTQAQKGSEEATTATGAQVGEAAPREAAAETAAVPSANQAGTDNASSASADAKAQDLDALDSTHFYMCFILQCLTELTSSYVACKVSMINCSKKKLAAISSGKDSSNPMSTPKGKGFPGVMTHFLSELVPIGQLEKIDKVDESRRRANIGNWAMSTVVALAADLGVYQSVKDIEPESISVRKQVLDAVAKALKDAAASSEPIEVRYGRLYSLAELCRRLLNIRPTSSPPFLLKQNEDVTLHMAKTMLEKNYVTILTSALADIDLNLPSVKTLLNAILGPLEQLTRIAIKTQSKNDRGSRNVDEYSDSEFESMDEDQLGYGSDREETPDFYRSSALGMHTGEMGEPEDSMDDDEDDDEMEDDEMGELDYSDDEDRSDLSDETDEDDDEDDDMEDDMVDVIDEDEEEDDEDGEVDELDDDENGWVDEDSEDDDSEGDSEEDALDFVLGEGQEGDHGLAPGLARDLDRYDLEGLPGDGEDVLGPIDLEAEGDTVDGESLDESQGTDEEIDILQDVGGPTQSNDPFGAPWTWSSGDGQRSGGSGDGVTLPPSFYSSGQDQAGDAAVNGTANARRPHRHRHSVAPPPSNPASHPLLDDQRDAPVQRSAGRRSRRMGQTGGYQDWAHSIEELVGGGAVELFDAIFGRGGEHSGADAPPGMAIRIDMGRGDGPPLQLGEVSLNGGPLGLAEGLNGHAGRSHHPRGPRPAQRAPSEQPPDPVAAVLAFQPAATTSRWSDEERIIFGTMGKELAGRLRNYIVSALLPRWKERQGQLEAATSDRDRIVEELAAIRARLRESEAEVSDLQAQASRVRQEGGGAQQTSSADTDAPQAAEQPQPRDEEDVEMSDAPAPAPSGDANSQPNLQLDSLQEGLRNLDGATASANAAAAPEGADDQGAGQTSETAPDVTSEGSADEASHDDDEDGVFVLNGREVDISGLGIDREVLAALPEEMQDEVIDQALRERRAATVTGADETNISPEFLDALPPELRAEVLEQEAAERALRRREEASTAGNEAESNEAAARPADSSINRETGASTSTNAANAAPPAAPSTDIFSSLRGTSRGDLAREFSRHLADMRRRLQGGEPGRPISGSRPDAGRSGDKQAQRDAIQLLDSNGIAALIRLLYFPGLDARSAGLHKVLANLSQNGKTRADILTLLLRILSEGSTDAHAVDKSFANMSAKAQGTPSRPTVKRAPSMGALQHNAQQQQQNAASVTGTSAKIAPLSRAGEEAPFLIASRSIETLLHLTSANEQAAMFFLREDPRLAKKSKGKEKDSGRGFAPINTLLGLLEKPSMLANAQVLDALIALLNTVTKHIPTLTAQAEKQRKDKEAAAAAKKKEKPADAATAAPGAPAAAETVAEDGKPAAESKDSDKDADAAASSAAPAAVKPPHISQERLAAVVRPLATAISSKGFQHTLAVASHLAGIDAESRVSVTQALQREATAATAVLSENLDQLLASLPPKKVDDGMDADESSVSVGAAGGPGSQQKKAASGAGTTRIQSAALPVLASPASAQARLLRSLRAIEWLHGGR